MKINASWEIPGALKDLLVLVRRGNFYAFPGIIDYFLRQRSDAHSISDASYLVWVDTFFRDFLYPFEFCEDLWNDYSAQLEEILNYSEHLLNLLKKFDENKNLKNNTETDLVVLSQHFDVYFCTLYHVQERQDEAVLRLRKILKTTEKNIGFLLSSPHVKDLYNRNNIALHGDLNVLGAEYYEEPLSFTVSELVSYDANAEIIAKIYAEYCDFLDSYTCQLEEAKEVLSKLKEKAEKRLIDLVGAYVIGYLDDAIEESYEEVQALISERAEFEKYITDISFRGGETK